MYNPKLNNLDDIVLGCLSKRPKDRPTVNNFRELIYRHMKTFYGESLHYTKDNKSLIQLAVSHAFYASKHDDISECITSLSIAKQHVIDKEMKSNIDNIITQLGILEKEKLSVSNETIIELEHILRDIQ